MSIQQHHFPTLTSTQTYLRENWDQLSLKSPQVLISTDRQTDGLGRQGAPWKHLNQSVAMSFAVSAHKPHVGLTALELGCLVINFFSGLPLQLKWPNDIIYQQKKCGGLILQNLSDNFFACGLGLNINSSQEELKGLDHGENASGLPSQGQTRVKDLSLQLYQFILQHRMNSFEIRQDFEKNCSHIQKNCLIKQGDEVLGEGLFIGVGEHGEALIKDPQGLRQKHFSGSLRWET